MISTDGEMKVTALRALKMGDTQRAHEISLQLLEMRDDVEVWLICSESSPTTEEKLNCLTQAHLRYPDDTRIKEMVYRVVKDQIEADPYLGYTDETGDIYRVTTRATRVLSVPKGRPVQEPFPPQRPIRIKQAYRLIMWAVFGLVFAGVGAVLFAPLAGLNAVKALQQPLNRADQARAQTAFVLAVSLFLLGLLFIFLLWLHIQG